MNILVTGANGFIGKHLCLLLTRHEHDVFKYDIDSTIDELKDYISKADFIIHLAGINRPLTNEEFYDGNTNFTKKLVDLVKESNRDIPIIFSSSIQAALDNDYGKSKKMAEDYLLSSGLTTYVYRLYNVFGKWCRPNYNSAAATFSYNIAKGLDISIRDRDYVVSYNYVEDICNTFIDVIEGKAKASPISINYVEPIYKCSLGHLADLLYYFKESVESDKHLPIIHDDFEYKLFVSFLDYLSDEGYAFNYAKDNRGYFEEHYKSKKYGQISTNMAYPNITKGGHYHTYKKEIFYVVKGTCEIKQRNIKNNDIIIDKVDGDHPNPINIIPMYTHSIKNIGDSNSITLMWISEIYSDDTADTYREDV
ncbi:MAG: NAD-dependent epimerase/dehydratase family protein [Bacilli bacterium]|nr:NAD-dependent epimerase/dehydratase family protein [Bacilli bacterium]